MDRRIQVFGVALGGSLLFHAALAAALVLYASWAPAPDALAQLDLTSVELSFAEEEDETAAARPVLAAAPPRPAPEEAAPPEPECPPPDSERVRETPPEPEAVSLPDPPPERPPIETPERPPARETPKEAPPQTAQAEAAPAAAPRQARVDAKPRPRARIRPDYPKEARQRGEQGLVLLEIAVDASGLVGDVTVVTSSGYPELDREAVRAVRAARFTPARRGHAPVASTVRLPVAFRLK